MTLGNPNPDRQFFLGWPRRDALFLGDCDDGVRQLCQLLGWEAELDALLAAGRAQFEDARPGEAAGGGGADAVLKATAEAAVAAAAAEPAGEAEPAAAPEPAGEAGAAAEVETATEPAAAQAAL